MAETAEAKRRSCGNPALGGEWRAAGIQMWSVAALLSEMLQRPVIDRTELTGRFDFAVTHASLRVTAQTDGIDDRPSLFVALEQQLGLKLELSRTPIPALVVDRLDRLIEN